MATICVIKGVVAWKEAIITKLGRCALKSTLLLFTSRRSKQYNILEEEKWFLSMARRAQKT